MKRDGQDPVRQIKGFLYAVAVVNVDVDIEDTRMEAAKRRGAWSATRRKQCRAPFESGSPKKLEDAEDDVVDVAEAACLALLSVMEAARPVDSNVGAAVRELARGRERRPGILLAEVVEAGKDGAVVAKVELLELGLQRRWR